MFTTIQAAISDPAPSEICWMPAGRHEINAHTLDGDGFHGSVLCDVDACGVIQESFQELKAAGFRCWIDCDHDDGAAAGWITGFRWHPSKGIMASIEWTPLGIQAIRDKTFYSFSPSFDADKFTGKINGLIPGHAAGGLVNAPAFRSMPSLVAARMGDAPEVEQEEARPRDGWSHQPGDSIPYNPAYEAQVAAQIKRNSF